MEKIHVTNLGSLAGYSVTEDLGIVSASIAPSRFITKDIMASIRMWFGKEMKEYTQMIEESRDVVIQRMIKKAEVIHADAILNIRFLGTGVSAGSAEMMGYGTAVILKKLTNQL